VHLGGRTARIGRSFSSGRFLGPTKTGRARSVELSSRLGDALRAIRPDLHGEEALVFPSETGGLLDDSNVRRVLARVLRRHLPKCAKRITPHSFRHTFASLHLSRGTNPLWVQRMGGWESPAVLFDTYAHFIPSELRGYADALSTVPNGTPRDRRSGDGPTDGRRTRKTPAPSRHSVVSAAGIEPATGGLRVRCSAN
jgi:integrase